MADGFLGRWAQRKQAVREGKAIEEPVTPAVRAELVEAPAQTGAMALRQAQGERTEIAAPSVPEEVPAPPTLQDTQTLTPQSDFKRFMAPDVDPEVKNAAMKKLFTDPHFNVMDRLDTYIDDYSLPDPLPESMLRQMASAKFLNLFDDEEDKKKPEAGLIPGPAPATPVDNAVPPAATPASPPPAALANLNDQDHVDPDLRLQQDHAAGPQGPGGGA